MSSDIEATQVNLFLHAENVRIFNTPQDRQLPVTIVTGFLGAGKTSLLSHILSNQSNLRIAAAINDFSLANIDENLIRNRPTGSGTAKRLFELSNGCVCCNLLDDLQSAVWKMLDHGGDVDTDAVNYLVVETSGVSEPLQIIRTLDAKFGRCFRARLDSVVVVVDADQVLSSSMTTSSQPISPAAVAQLQCADVILVNKIDLLEDPENDGNRVQDIIRRINVNAVIHRTIHCKVPLSAILDVQLPSSSSGGQTAPISHEATNVPFYVSATGGSHRCLSSVVSKLNKPTTTSHLALDEDVFVSVSASVQDGPLSLCKLQQFVASSLVQRLTRMKGVLWIQGGGLNDYRCVLHLSGRGRLGFTLDGKWMGPPLSEMAFIGQSSVVHAGDLQSEFSICCISSGRSAESGDGSESSSHQPEFSSFDHNGDHQGDNDKHFLSILRNSQEFLILDDIDNTDTNQGGLYYFRLTGSKVYGYTDEEIERDLRIDTDAMNIDLCDAINASVLSTVEHDAPKKAFLVYSRLKEDNGRVVLCYPAGSGEPANNLKVLFREARAVLSTHFRNVQVCKCGS